MREFRQVILTGAPHHGATEPNQAPTPAKASASSGQRMLAAADAHPLRPYWDYLAFLLRRLPPLAPEEEMERSYRDYLQVCGGSLLHSEARLPIICLIPTCFIMASCARRMLARCRCEGAFSILQRGEALTVGLMLYRFPCRSPVCLRQECRVSGRYRSDRTTSALVRCAAA